VRCDVSIAVTLQIVRQLVVMLAPVVPFSMTKVWGWLGMETDLHRGGWAEGWPEPLQPRATGVDSADPASRAVV
jgi:methionyl-tRNA synthetase